MLYVLLILVALLIGVLILHLRLHTVWSEQHRLVAVSLGRHTGVELDLRRDLVLVRLAGVTIHRRRLAERKAAGPTKPSDKKRQPSTGKLRTLRKRRSLRAIFASLRDLLPSILSASWNFVRGLIRAGVVEEVEGRIEGGFDSPDRTGQAFGYYQAVLGMVPALAGRLVFVPDWTGESFAASGRLTVSLPLYRFVWRTLVLLWQLPSRKILKMAIHKERGEQDVK